MEVLGNAYQNGFSSFIQKENNRGWEMKGGETADSENFLHSGER